ncbi:MAG: magnesium/cobalt transporter CorA [Acidobacteriota bacterium]
MLHVLTSSDSRVHAIEAEPGTVLPEDTVWFDLYGPSRAEERLLEHTIGVNLPTREEMQEIEPSSRLYREDGAMFMTANVVWRADTAEPESTAVSFILAKNRLVTIRYADPKSFRVFAAHAERHSSLCSSGSAVLVNLLDGIVDRTADILERVGTEVDGISKTIFHHKDGDRSRRITTEELQDALTRMGRSQDLTSKARDSLVSLSRLLSFLRLPGDVKSDDELRERVRSLSRDVLSLTDHATFISNNINFLLDATLGLINVEQNAIIKIFSVAAVVFLPPTLVASIYGMNFKHMPELDWGLGYPWAIVLMILSAILPYVWFKRRGWL